jgi:hypothetical protein
MAFIVENNTTVSFADFSDVIQKDQRLFEANEGLSDDIVENHLIRATERILTRLRSSDWWQNYYYKRYTGTDSITKPGDIPPLDPNRILDRQNDFTDLCVYTAFSEYILPQIADFSNEDSAERRKMSYYTQRAQELYGELITAGDWYDFSGTGTITSDEKEAGRYNLKRVR